MSQLSSPSPQWPSPPSSKVSFPFRSASVVSNTYNFLAAVAGGYWPVSTPSRESPWVLGKDNAVTWSMGGDLGITEFDIQLHNFNKSLMLGFLQLAQNVPVQKWASGSKKVSGMKLQYQH